MTNEFTGFAPWNYQHLNLGLMEKAGAHLQQKQDQDLEDTYKLQNLIGNLKSATFDRPFKRELDSKYYPVLTSIADKISKGDQSYHNDLIKTRTQFLTDPEVQTLGYNYSKEQDYLKDKDIYQKDSKYDPVYDTRDRFTKDRTQLTPFDYQGMTAKEDYNPHSEDLMKGIAEDSRGWEGYQRDKETGELLLNSYGQLQKTDGKVEALTPDKVRQVAQRNISSFLSGKGGNYFIHKILGQEANLEDLSQEVQNYIVQAAEDHLYNVGSKYIFSKKKSGEDYQNIPEHNFSDKESLGSIEDSPFQNVKYNYDNLLNALDKKSTIDNIKIGGSTLMVDKTPDKSISIRNQGRDFTNLSGIEKQTLDRLKILLKGPNDEKTYSNITEYLSNIKEKKISVPYISYDDKQIDKVTKYLDANLAGRLVYDPEENKIYDGSTFRSEVQKKGTSKELKIQAIGEGSTDNFYTDISGNDRFAQPQMITLGDKSYIVGMSKGEYDSRAGKIKIALNQISASRRSGIPIDLNDSYKGVSTYKDNRYTITFNKAGIPGSAQGETESEVLQNYIDLTKE